MKNNKQSNWKKEFEAKEFKKWFGVELNTPISGRIVAEEKAAANNELGHFHNRLVDFDERIKYQKSFIAKIIQGERQRIIGEVGKEIEKRKEFVYNKNNFYSCGEECFKELSELKLLINKLKG